MIAKNSADMIYFDRVKIITREPQEHVALRRLNMFLSKRVLKDL